jgi:hypothetical protein
MKFSLKNLQKYDREAACLACDRQARWSVWTSAASSKRDHNELMKDQEDLTTIQKIENQEIHQN